MRGAHPHLPLVMQDELQSDGLAASLEKTKAKVEKCIERSDDSARLNVRQLIMLAVPLLPHSAAPSLLSQQRVMTLG